MKSFNASNARFLLTIDPSLTCSGWALFSAIDARLLGVGKIRSLKPSISLAGRYQNLQEQIQNLFEQIDLGSSDVLVCEAQTTMRDPKAAFKVEQVRGIFETLARQRGTLVPGRLNPRTVHYEILGLKGKQAKRQIIKDSACVVARRLYGECLLRLGFDSVENLKKHQDIVDALLVGSVIMGRMKRLAHAREPLSKLFIEAT